MAAMLQFDLYNLSLDFSDHAAFAPERAASSLSTAQVAMYNESIVFFLEYFNMSTSLATSQSISSGVLMGAYGLFDILGASTAAGTQSALVSGVGVEVLNEIHGVCGVLAARGFNAIPQLGNLFFVNARVDSLYADFITLFADSYYAYAYTGTGLAQYSVQVRWLFELVYSADIFLVCIELLALLGVLGFGARVTGLFASTRAFYDDIVTFCKTNNISLTEVGVFFTFFLGFLVFDLFISAVDEDVTDVFAYFMLAFVVLLFFFLILGTDLQYYYMISSISNGDLALRVIVFDVINNFLCVLRIFFCWVRYIFYDLQVELVDFTFHYTDSINDLSVLALYDGGATGWFNSGFIASSGSSLFGVAKASGWVLVYLYLDISILIAQMLIGFAKFFIAFFLLWLIVDLFILKAFVHAEAHYLHLRRAATRA